MVLQSKDLNDRTASKTRNDKRWESLANIYSFVPVTFSSDGRTDLMRVDFVDRTRQRSVNEQQLKDWMLLSFQGDREAYQKLLERIATIVRAYFSLTFEGERAEELVQDVLFLIHQKKHLYRTTMPMLPWVYAIARYRMIDALRSDARKPLTVHLTDDQIDSMVFAEAEETIVPNAQELFAGLSEKQKEALVLTKLEGLSLAETASRLKMSLAAVKVTIFRARRKLQEKLSGSNTEERSSYEEEHKRDHPKSRKQA